MALKLDVGNGEQLGVSLVTSLSALSVARVMIAQCENKCISRSVLSMVRVMIAQWENECISLSDLSAARVMIVHWENECISLSVLSMARVMIAQGENECILLSVLPMAMVHSPAVVEHFNGLSLTDHICWVVERRSRRVKG